MAIFGRKHKDPVPSPPPGEPVLHVSICTGETSAGFILENGTFQEERLIRSESDLEEFRKIYHITGKLKKIY